MMGAKQKTCQGLNARSFLRQVRSARGTRGRTSPRSTFARHLLVESLEQRLALAGNVLSGFVYLDGNDDGQRATTEVGVPGVMITLSGVPTTGGSLIRTTVTGSDGAYQFDAVPAGTYTLVERQPAALIDGSDSSSVAGAVVTNDQIANLAVSGDQTFGGNNFGESEVRGSYVTIAWMFASKQQPGEALLDTLTLGEKATGDTTFAAMIDASNDASGGGNSPGTGGASSAGNGATPTAVSDLYSLTGGQHFTATAATGVLANDTDADGNTLTAILVSVPAHGMVSLQSSGAFSYVPNSGYSGSDSFQYAASDGTHISAAATVSLRVEGSNSAPAAVADSYTVDQGGTMTTPAASGVLANDTDLDGGVLTAELATNVAHGTLTLRPDGSFDYVPAVGYSGSDSFTYRAKDVEGLTSTATVSLAVRPLPTAVADTYSANQNQTLTVPLATGVLANDSNPAGGTLTAAVVTGPAHGTLTLAPNGSLTYAPATDYFGADSFTYKAINGTLNSAPTTVTLNVARANRAPTALPNSYIANEDTPLVVNIGNGVLANDTDDDGDPLTATLGTSPTHGTLTLNSDGSFTYSPTANYSGVDSFTYSVGDGFTTTTATVALTVSERNDPPVAVDDTYVVSSGGVLTVPAPGVLGNDTDADVNPELSAAIDVPPAHGTLTMNADGSFTYTPAAGFHGTDTFTYQVNDIPAGSDCMLICNADGSVTGSDGQIHTDVGTVTIHVNSAPTTVSDSYTVAEDGTLEVLAATGVLANDSDPESDALTASLGTPPAHGVITFRANGSFTYLPTANYHGSDTFTYKVSDGLQTTAVQTVSLTVTSVNDAPTGVADSYTVGGGGLLTTTTSNGVLANDGDGDGDSLTATVVTQPSHGTLTLNANGSFSYQATAGFHGTDTFAYRASDGTASSADTTVSIVVNGAPTPVADAYSTNEDTTLTVSTANGVLKNDTDPESDPLSATLVTNASHGTVTLSSVGSFQYVPVANFSGTDTFTYKANDGRALSAETTVTITVNAVNDAPVAVNDSYTATEDQTLTIAVADGVLKNDTDADLVSLTAALTASPAHGTLQLQTNGSFTYVPAANYSGPDSFRYRTSDGQANSAEATVSITVTAANDPPVGVADNYVAVQNTPLVVPATSGVLANDTDSDSVSLTAAVVSGPSLGTLTLNSNGSFTYTPATNYSGLDTFTYRASDGLASSANTTVTIQVQGTNNFTIEENAANGAAVGEVTPTSEMDPNRIYEIVDANLPADLRLAADDHLSGNPAARVVLIEYLDIQCPPCGLYHPIIRSLEEQFPDDLLVVRRHLPLTSIHPNAVAAARAAEAADRQGSYEDFIDLAYSNQSQWSASSTPQTFFDNYATQLGLDITQFHQDIADPTVAARVQRDMDAAARMSINATPTFFLNGEKVASPPASVAGFSNLIFNELAATTPAFVIDRITGDVLVSDNAQLNSVTQPTTTFDVRIRDANGASQVVPVTIHVVPVGEGEGAAESASWGAQIDELFAQDDDWLAP